MKVFLIQGLIGVFLLSLHPAYSQTYYQEISAAAGISHPGLNRSAAVGDFNNDGHDDIFVCQVRGSNLLYKNNGDNTFTEVAAELGLNKEGNSNTAVWGDLDNDGWLDLYVAIRQEANLLYHNNGDGTFTEMAIEAGVAAQGDPRSVHVVDVNRDGLLDIYIANLREQNILYQNMGNLQFEDRVYESNTRDILIAQAAVFFDYDNDGDQDLYLSHDAYETNILYQNDGNGYFTDVSVISRTDIEIQSMGVDIGDINHDGWLDMYITNLGKNVVLMNNQDGTFSNVSTQTGLIDNGMGWGSCFLDFDNDGFIDLYTANDSYFSPFPNVLQRNLGNDTFEIVDQNTAIASMAGGYGVASLDINKDGLLELFVANTGSDGNQFFLNITPTPGNYLKIKAQGTTSNRDAIGTKITLEAEGRIFTDEVNAGSGFASQNSQTLHFGLGNLQVIDKMTVVWPNGEEEVFENIAINQTISLIEGEGYFNNSIPIYEVTTWPNPAKNSMQIKLAIQKPQFIDIQLLGLRGERIERILSQEMESGSHLLKIDRNKMGSGLYLLQIQSDQGVDFRKIWFR